MATRLGRWQPWPPVGGKQRGEGSVCRESERETVKKGEERESVLKRVSVRE